MNNKLIAAYLLKKRKEIGITQKELADEMGVTFQAVSRWEKGDSIPDLGVLDQLATFYHVSIDEILQRDTMIKEEFNPRWIMFGATILMYLIGLFAVAFGKDASLPNWAETLGYGIAVFMFICGAFVQQVFYFVISDKTKKDYFTYIITYIPLALTIIFFILIHGGVID